LSNWPESHSKFAQSAFDQQQKVVDLTPFLPFRRKTPKGKRQLDQEER